MIQVQKRVKVNIMKKEEMYQFLKIIRLLINRGMPLSQIVLRAGVNIKACREDLGLQLYLEGLDHL